MINSVVDLLILLVPPLLTIYPPARARFPTGKSAGGVARPVIGWGCQPAAGMAAGRGPKGTSAGSISAPLRPFGRGNLGSGIARTAVMVLRIVQYSTVYHVPPFRLCSPLARLPPEINQKIIIKVESKPFLVGLCFFYFPLLSFLPFPPSLSLNLL